MGISANLADTVFLIPAFMPPPELVLRPCLTLCTLQACPAGRPSGGCAAKALRLCRCCSLALSGFGNRFKTDMLECADKIRVHQGCIAEGGSVHLYEILKRSAAIGMIAATAGTWRVCLLAGRMIRRMFIC